MDHRISRRQITVYWLLTVILFFAGVAFLSSYLVREHRRLSLVQILMLWSSEAVGAFWFVRFGVRHLLLGLPLATTVGRREHTIVFVSLFAGWLLDAGLTGYRFLEEELARRRAVQTVGRVTEGAVRKSTWGGPRFYHIQGDFTDQDGVTHPLDMVRDSDALPAVTWTAVETGRLPASLPLWYDPEWPPRVWLPNDLPTDRIHAISGMTLLLQLGFLVVLLLVGSTAKEQPFGSLPVEQIGPFTLCTFVLFVVGWWRWSTGQDIL